MKSSFIAYVDESGDEGFVFKADGSGSSSWFVLSATVIRRSNDQQMVSCLKEVRAVLQKEPKTPLHFVDLKHDMRVPYIRRVGELPMRTVSVLVYNPLIAEPEKFQNTKYLLYRYATRLLLERVSWLGRDQRRAWPVGPQAQQMVVLGYAEPVPVGHVRPGRYHLGGRDGGPGADQRGHA